MKELEAAEAAAAKAFARQNEVAAAQRLAVTRQLELLQQASGAGVAPLGSFSATSDRTLLPPHLSGSLPLLLFGHHDTPTFSAGIVSLGSATPVNVARSAALMNAPGLAAPANDAP
jgi:hypothetical protein